MQVLSLFAPDIDTDVLVEELGTAKARETKSGLYRVDSLEFGRELQKLVQEVGLALNGLTSIESVWGMIHYPEGGEVFMHSHNNWKTAIYYPKATTCGLLLDEKTFLPRARDLVLLEAGCVHGVAANTTEEPRYSVVFTYE